MNHLRIENIFNNTSFLTKIGGNHGDIWKVLDKISQFLNTYELDENGNYIHESAQIHSNSIIKNSFIGENSKIYEFVSIRDSVIGNNCVIGHCSEIARSVLVGNISIPRFNYIGASIIGNNVRLGGVCSFASRRFDDNNVYINVNKEKVQTNKFKFGSIVGDNCIIGFASHFNPGTVIEKDCIIMPHTEIKGTIPKESIVSIKSDLLISPKRNLEKLGLNSIKPK